MLASPGHEPVHGAIRVHETVARTEAAADDVVGPKLGKVVVNFISRDQPDVFQAQRDLLFIIGPQIFHLRGAGSAEQIALRTIAAWMA